MVTITAYAVGHGGIYREEVDNHKQACGRFQALINSGEFESVVILWKSEVKRIPAAPQEESK